MTKYTSDFSGELKFKNLSCCFYAHLFYGDKELFDLIYSSITTPRLLEENEKEQYKAHLFMDCEVYRLKPYVI